LAEEEKNTVKITIDGAEYEVEQGKTVLQAALDNGVFIPHYCYHPHLSIDGNCRMCLVDIKPGPPKLSIACNTVVQDGMEIDTKNEKVEEARRAVMEFILKNHPIDCPICDQAGECWLQEYYMAYDKMPSRVSPSEKIRKRKNLKVGRTLVLDSERCILCSRCVRFMREVANDDCLVIANRGDHAEITLFPGKEEIDNPYSMCLVDVCPVGAWTSADFRFKHRVWFLTSAASICQECARGCNIWIDYRRQEVYRFRPRRNDQVNKTWMCDEGRLSYHAINDNRLTVPAVSAEGGKKRRVSWDEALAEASRIITEAGSNLAVVVSAKLSLQEGKKALELFGEKLKANLYLHTGAPGWEDDILRKADMNSNTRGLTELGIKDPVDKVAEGATVVVLEGLCPNPLPQSLPAPAIAISPQFSPAVEAARVALPAASFAETSGTVVNFDGVSQDYPPAIKPKGEALPHVEIMDRLARVKAGGVKEAV